MKKTKCLLALICLVFASCTAVTEVFEEPQVLSPATPIALGSPAPTRTGALCPDPYPPLITTLEVLQPPELSEPAARQPFRDPVFGACMVRVTDRRSDPTADAPAEGLKNEYSRVQSFNADGSRILVRSLEANWYLYDASSLQVFARLPLSIDPRWDAKDPDLIYHTDETRLLSYRISTGEQTELHDFATDFPGETLSAVWTRYEGSPSADSRYWGLMAENEDWETIAFLVYDRQEDRVVSRMAESSDKDIDSVTISPLGTYFLAYYDYCEQGNMGTGSKPCGLMVYERNFTNPRGLLRLIGHSDVALDAQGREVLIYQDIDTDTISMLDLASGQITPLFPIDFSHTSIGLHFSGRALQAPGWALVSTYSGGYPTSFTWMDNQVFAVELKPQGRVVRLAHTHSIVDENQEHDYWAEPQASASPDFHYVVFTSNWGRSGSGEVEMYLIELPVGWWNNLP
jgi:hypothetical protein